MTRLVGTIPAGPNRQIRVSLTEEKGQAVIDVRDFDFFASVWMPSKRGVAIPAQQAEAFAVLAAEASAAAREVGQ